MRRLATLSLLAIGFGLLAPSSEAAAGWGIPNLNPFASDKKEKPRGPNESPRGGWGLPKLPLPKLPGFGGNGTQQPRGPGGKKTMLTKTKETLFPWTKSEPAPQKFTGATRRYQPRSSFSSDNQEKSTSIFSSWFAPAEKEEPLPLAPHEWLANPRPD